MQFVDADAIIVIQLHTAKGGEITTENTRLNVVPAELTLINRIYEVHCYAMTLLEFLLPLYWPFHKKIRFVLYAFLFSCNILQQRNHFSHGM